MSPSYLTDNKVAQSNSNSRPNNEDIPTARNQTNAPSSTSVSVRSTHTSIASLPIICLHAFVYNFNKLMSDEANARALKRWILTIPDSFLPKMLIIMKERGVYPSNDFIATVCSYHISSIAIS